jgi:hypothetical protein
MSSNLDVRGTEAQRSHRSLPELGIDAAGRHLDAIRGCVGTDLEIISDPTTETPGRQRMSFT